MILTRPLLCLILFCCLSGCGFHLRGHTALPPQLHRLSLETRDPYNAFTRQLIPVLTHAGIQVVPTGEYAPLKLTVLSDSFIEQTTSANTANQLTIFSLSETIVYQLTDPTGRVIRGPSTLSAQRNYSVNSNQVLSSTQEQPLLRQEMRRDLIVQLLYQLASKNTRLALDAL